MSSDAVVNDPLGIIELATLCRTMQAHNVELFEQLGGWVADTVEPELQRLFAEGAHRHAWHAELWALRTPAIPPTESVAPISPARAADTPKAERAAAYRDQLESLLADLRAAVGRVDPLLDPATVRTAALAIADLADLERRLG